MFKFLQSKKGLTLIELLVVLALLSLGFVAMGNLVKVTYRAFNKAEERYIKQEMVKDVANYLQKGTNITAAKGCWILDNTEISSIKNFNDYAYLYAEFEEHEDPKKTGYYLYMMDRDTLQANARCLNEGVPLNIWFEPIVTEDKNDEGVVIGTHNEAGIIVHLAAMEDEYKYTVDENTGMPIINSNDRDYQDMIYYQLQVGYHFPNMVESKLVVEPYKEEEESEDDGASAQAEGDVVEPRICTAMLAIDSLYKGDASNAEISTTSFCFIATASYGENSGEVGLLCDFRDKCLLTNPLGTAFVKAYYKLSPPIADFIAESEPLKAAVRVALKPLVVIATNALDSDLAAENAPWFIVFVLCAAGSTAMVVNITKKRKKAESK